MRGVLRALLVVAAAVFLTPASAQTVRTGVTRSFTCFFEEGSSLPNPRCRLVIEELARVWGEMAAGRHACRWMGGFSWICGGRDDPPARAQTTVLEVNGLASDTDDNEAALALGSRRADAVAGLLRENGVPAENTVVRPRGRQELINPSEPTDPVNRSVWVRLR